MNLYIDSWAEEERISARGWRTRYLTGRMKNDVSRRAGEERHILARRWRTTHLGAFTAGTQPVNNEIRRSSSSRRDTLFFILAARYVGLDPRAAIRFSSAQSSICSQPVDYMIPWDLRFLQHNEFWVQGKPLNYLDPKEFGTADQISSEFRFMVFCLSI